MAQLLYTTGTVSIGTSTYNDPAHGYCNEVNIWDKPYTAKTDFSSVKVRHKFLSRYNKQLKTALHHVKS